MKRSGVIYVASPLMTPNQGGIMDLTNSVLLSYLVVGVLGILIVLVAIFAHLVDSRPVPRRFSSPASSRR